MASLWRILALSWLGGVASPILMDDPAIADALARPVAASIQPVGEEQAIEISAVQSPSDEESGSFANAGD